MINLSCYFVISSIMDGGAETGFRHVTPQEYEPRLLHFRKEGRCVTLREVYLFNQSNIFMFLALCLDSVSSPQVLSYTDNLRQLLLLINAFAI